MSRTVRTVNHPLAEFELFEGCSARELEIASSLITPVVVEAGTVLIHQGSPAREAFMLGSGTARVVQVQDDAVRELGLVVAGEPLGEMSILANEPRMATVITLTRSTVYAATAREFSSLMVSVPSFEAKVIEFAARRRELNAA